MPFVDQPYHKNNSSSIHQQGLTYVHLVKTSITHKHLTPTLFLEDNDPNSAKSAAQKLSLNLQSVTKYLRLTLVFTWNSALWEKFNFYFSRVFC